MEITTSRYDIAARITVMNYDGFTGVLSAVTQRALFGRNIFGRKTVTIDCTGQGKVYGTFSVSYGTDSVFFDKSFAEIATLSSDPGSIISF